MDYDALREKFRPDRIRLLIIAEAPPSVRPGEQPRFFYDAETHTEDHLYVETMSVIFFDLVRGLNGERSQSVLNELRNNKDKYLNGFKKHGFWLQNAIPYPLPAEVDRTKEIKANLPRLREIVDKNHPEACVLIGRLVYDNLANDLKRARTKVLNSRSIPLPASSQQARFRREMGDVLYANGILPLTSRQ